MEKKSLSCLIGAKHPARIGNSRYENEMLRNSRVIPPKDLVRSKHIGGGDEPEVEMARVRNPYLYIRNQRGEINGNK